ncbi:MAG: ABC transporter permease [Verrucomicrobia bacterium]|jgi:ABC-2 type transport system permease protein|nr:ABC transporter permease [Verrucomicrobiota bacterium]
MFMQASYSLALREVTRFLRQKNRVIGAMATPVLFWFLLGSGVGRSLVAPGFRERTDYLTYFFPGIVLLIILFTAIFSTVSVIEDRREGFLQGVLVAPDGRSAILFGKLMGGTMLAVFQAIVVVLLAPYSDYHPDARVLLNLFAMIAVLAVGLTALGFLIAWPMDSTQGFHALINLFFVPLWFLSGALFPPSGAAGWIRALMHFNPLSYGHDALAGLLATRPGMPLPVDLSHDFSIVCVTTLLLVMACTVQVSRRS